MLLNWFKNTRMNYVERQPVIPKIISPRVDVTITREPDDDQGTYGLLQTYQGFFCRSIELPNRGNRSNMSRIPAGIYTCKSYNSRRFGKCFIIEGVKHRTYILFHSGNLAGDTLKGFKTNSHGCILLGKYKGKLQGQKAVMVSRPVIRSFFNIFDHADDFTLEIKEAA